MTVPLILDAAHRRGVVGGEPMIFHCHHYNCFLQRSILDAEDVESQPFLIGAAAEVAHHQLSTIFATMKIYSPEGRKAMAETLYRWAGFGTLDFGSLDERGGTTSTPHSHYASGWRVKFGPSDKPICVFSSGWVAGALAAVYDLPNGSFSVVHDLCLATKTSDVCRFRLERAPANYALFSPVGVGALSDHRPRPVPASGVDYDGIFKALSSMEIVGDSTGSIPAFGVYLTHHYANYYNRISFELERALQSKLGEEGRRTAEPLLVEAGHVCAFHTFGGIMTSPEWDALIRPSLKSREDWVHGMVAATNALGWGRWQVTSVSEREAEFVLHDDYEAVGHLAMYGKSDHPVSYLAQGGVAGLMNLVYLGHIADKPDLSVSFYNALFKGDGVYRAEPLSSKAMGDEVTAFRVVHD
jgi:hypothetical protein